MTQPQTLLLNTALHLSKYRIVLLLGILSNEDGDADDDGKEQ